MSVETLFTPRGYASLRGDYSGAQALRRIRESAVDVLVLDRHLRDMTGAQVCEEVRQHRLVTDTTPIVLISPEPWSRDEKLNALRAGAWDVYSLPMDGEEFFLRVDTWVRAKLTVDRDRKQGLLDPDTGLYNAQGLLRRIEEHAAAALRHNRPIGCVVLSVAADKPLSGPDAEPAWSVEVLTALADTLRSVGRSSDTIARLSSSDFVIVAPDTDSAGIICLAERLNAAIAALPARLPSSLLRFGCYAVANFRDAALAPSDLLIRAAEALRGGYKEQQTIRFFTPPRHI